MSLDERKLEQISAGVDGESAAPGADAQGWVNDHHGRSVWSRYHLIGDLLRHDLSPQAPIDVRANVASALAQEPVVLAPQQLRKGKSTGSLQQRLLGLAVAASVALVVVVGVQRFQTGGALGVAPQLAQTEPTTQSIIGGPEFGSDIVRVGGTRWAAAQPAVELRLNGYLMDHSEQTAGVGVQAMVPSVQLVGYDD